MRFAAALLVCASVLAQSPAKIEYACPPEDIDAFGLSCSPDDPCHVFLELSSIEAAGAKLFVVGDLHTESMTLYGVLLASEDGGKTWTEPLQRIRAAALEQIEFIDIAKGWISGQSIEPLPRDPFFLITEDGGKSWRQKVLFEDSIFGAISQFWFDSPTTGELVLDREVNGRPTHERYQTNTAGESWELEESTTKPVTLKTRKDSTWRLRADGKQYSAQRRGSAGWETVANFSIAVTECR